MAMAVLLFYLDQCLTSGSLYFASYATERRLPFQFSLLRLNSLGFYFNSAKNSFGSRVISAGLILCVQVQSNAIHECVYRELGFFFYKTCGQ